MTTGLKAKWTKTASYSAPREINDNTKARRAWLAEKLAEVSALPDTRAKIVGTGSYQQVSVWTATYTEGRVRFRGICQVCGNSQVVEGGVLVLHGYLRPGYGYTIGKCPGAGKVPLQTSCALTVAYRLAELDTVDRIVAALPGAEKAAEKALAAYYAQRGAEERRPERPWRDKSNEAMAKFEADLAAWKKANPVTALRDATQENFSNLRTGLNQAKGAVEHFGQLIEWRQNGVLGRPALRDAGLEEEVVV